MGHRGVHMDPQTPSGFANSSLQKKVEDIRIDNTSWYEEAEIHSGGSLVAATVVTQDKPMELQCNGDIRIAPGSQEAQPLGLRMYICSILNCFAFVKKPLAPPERTGSTFEGIRWVVCWDLVVENVWFRRGGSVGPPALRIRRGSRVAIAS